MNKRKVDELIPRAYRVLGDVHIAEDGKINKAWSGQISSFGASIAQGSLLAAISFFSAQGGATIKRERLMMAIWLLLNEDERLDISFDFDSKNPKDDDKKKKYQEAATRLYKQVEVQRNDKKIKEDTLTAAVALKLAMNLYDMGKGEKNSAESEQDES